MTALALTIGPATDYLYGLAQAAVAGKTVNGDPWIATDGEANLVNGMFTIGLDNPPPDVSGQSGGTVAAIIMGGSSAQEQHDIPCFIDARVAGDVQKAARDAVESVFNPFWNALMADRSLGELLHGGGAQIVNVMSIPRKFGTVGEPARRQLLTFSVRCSDLQLAT